MQLISSFSGGIKPLTLAAGLLTASTSFMYADVDTCSNIVSEISNNQTSKYIQEVDDREDSLVLNKRIFHDHLEVWQMDTMFLSSISDIIEHRDFKAIVAMGKKAVPFIVEEIQREPSQLVWALNLIYNKKITDKPNTTITEACKLWVKMLRS
jgi:hypothetical protein